MQPGPQGPGTHSQIQHVHRHRLLRQHLHGGVGVDRDGAAAHCKGTTAGAESGSAGRAARRASFGGPHTGRHWRAHPRNLQDPFAKTKPRRPPVTFPKSRRHSFPTEREATAGDAPRESEQNRENLTAHHGLTLSPIFQGRSPAPQGSLQQPLGGWESRNPWKCTRAHPDRQSLPCDSPENNSPPHARFPSSPAPPALLTEVLGGRAILSMDRHDSRFEDLQGGDVRGEDTEGAGQRGHVHLLHVGAVVKHLDGEGRADGNNPSPGTEGKERGGSLDSGEPRGAAGSLLPPRGPEAAALLPAAGRSRGLTHSEA